MAIGRFEGSDPLIQISLGAPDHPPETVTCLVDTGFDGFLLISEAQAAPLHLTGQYPGNVEYADSSTAARPYCVAVAEIDGVRRRGLVALEPVLRRPLLGIKFMKAFGLRLILDPSDNRVELVPAPPFGGRIAGPSPARPTRQRPT